MKLDGYFYQQKYKEYSSEQVACIEDAVRKLEGLGDKPLMMLGRVQSGKTKTFIGAIALAFDNGYEMAIVLTKGTKALSEQTLVRMQKEFSACIEDDRLDVYDIMSMPDRLRRYELNKKIIIIAKKEQKNLPKLRKAIENHEITTGKRCLIIDDEADFASVGFEKANEVLGLRKIASEINNIRGILQNCRFIQVTATPYSLYLQPETFESVGSGDIVPIKPAQTVLVPSSNGYIGGKYYFDSEENPYCDYLFQALSAEELEILKKPDRRRFKEEEILTSPKVKGLRNAIIGFVVGGVMLNTDCHTSSKLNKYSFIVHTETQKAHHQRQEQLISGLIESLEDARKYNTTLFRSLIKDTYDDLRESMEQGGFTVPDFEAVYQLVCRAIDEEWIACEVVNSENDVSNMLDSNGQLRLRTPLNVFVGGQILDRGITISNLIGFYYGRRPKKMQQDTVLQHARMYGYRKPEDLTVTRFYTTTDIYDQLIKINRFDEQLREDFEKGKMDSSLVFISKDDKGRVVPCSPNKIVMSKTQMIKSGGRILPIGFDLGSKTKARTNAEKIDKLLSQNIAGYKSPGSYVIPKALAHKIVSLVYGSIEIETDTCIDEKGFRTVLDYLAEDSIHLLTREGRGISRTRETSRYYSDMPDNRDGDLKPAKALAKDKPALILLKQNCTIEGAWKYDVPFWWPVLVVQEQAVSSVFASELVAE